MGLFSWLLGDVEHLDIARQRSGRGRAFLETRGLAPGAGLYLCGDCYSVVERCKCGRNAP